jgi:hypothetical protein
MAMLDDLGYRASDILQANSVIWVEGPSDRTYLNAWLHTAAPDLIEGVHYVIMFYGGAMLERLSALAEGDEDSLGRVPLRRIQQHFAIVADSDRRAAADLLKSRVLRVASESETNPAGHMWITSGRTIENYIPAGERLAAVQAVHPSVHRLVNAGNTDADALRAVKADGTRLRSVDKVAVAEAVVTARPAAPEGAAAALQELIEFIQRAN